MKKTNLIMLACCLLLALPCLSQNWQWAKHFGSKGSGSRETFCSDSSGNSYITGNVYGDGFSNTVYEIFGNDSMYIHGLSDAYIVKVDNSGNFIRSEEHTSELQSH